MIAERYRQDYDGEFVVLETRITANATKQVREWIPNTVVNQHISGRAAVIGSDVDRKFFEWRRLYRHRGGLLAKKKLQTYGVAELAGEMPFDFVFVNDEDTAQKLEIPPDLPTVFFSTAKLCMKYPGCYHPVPYLPNLNRFSIALYLAAFDAHKEIFLIGYSGAMPVDSTSWEADIKLVFDTYRNTQFYIVGRGDYPDSWRECLNVKHMQYRKFIIHCDV